MKAATAAAKRVGFAATEMLAVLTRALAMAAAMAMAMDADPGAVTSAQTR